MVQLRRCACHSVIDTQEPSRGQTRYSGAPTYSPGIRNRLLVLGMRRMRWLLIAVTS